MHTGGDIGEELVDFGPQNRLLAQLVKGLLCMHDGDEGLQHGCLTFVLQRVQGRVVVQGGLCESDQIFITSSVRHFFTNNVNLVYVHGYILGFYYKIIIIFPS